MTPSQQDAIKQWAAEQVDTPSLAEAIRRLVEMGLASASPSRSKNPGAAANAPELAGAQIDRLADVSASGEVQSARKRRLLKGPEEFQDLRADRKKR